jgi:hypothetical protein
MNANERKHCDGGPAIEFADGWKLWALNDVVVTQEIAETPASELDPNMYFKLNNIEVQREFLRKIGIERLFNVVEKKLIDEEILTIGDKSLKYELYSIKLSNELWWNYLKMEHASMKNVVLLEPVDENCKTVRDCIKFRNNNLEKLPLQIS